MHCMHWGVFVFNTEHRKQTEELRQRDVPAMERNMDKCGFRRLVPQISYFHKEEIRDAARKHV